MKTVSIRTLFVVSLMLCSLNFCVAFSSTLFLSPVQEDTNSLFDLQPIDQDYGIPFTFGPEPDTCSQKLQNLKENLERKANFMELGLKFYSYDIKSICFLCGDEQVGVSVCNKKSSAVPESFEDVGTIIKLFDYVSDVIMRADGVQVEYDEKLHYPTKVFVDFLAAGLDDGLTYEITNFKKLSKNKCEV